MAPESGAVGRTNSNTAASWVDFSGIENPFGTPESFVTAVSAAVNSGLMSMRPDRDASALRNTLSRSLSLPSTSFLVGSTISSMISAISQTFEPGEVGVSTPCPAEYVLALSNAGHRIKRIPLSSSYVTPTAEALTSRNVQIGAAVLANPSYPTSRLLSKSTLISYLETCAWVVVDERSIELTLGGESVAPMVMEYKNLIVVQTFSEQYALPAAHVSYCIAHPDTIAEIKRFYDASGISILPDALAEPSLVEYPKLEGVRGFLYSEIPWMQTMLSLLPGIDIVPAEANYVMCSYRNDGSLSRSVPDVDELATQLDVSGFGIKKLEGTPGLGSSDYFCVAVRTRQQNEQLISAIRTIVTAG